MAGPTRARALMADCPKCKALAGSLCIGRRGERRGPHRARFSAPIGEPVKIVRTTFYESDDWRRVRYQALTLHGGACQCCGARPVRGKPLHVDHIKPRSKFPELALDVSNLQVLCADCNLGKGAWDQTDWRTA